LDLTESVAEKAADAIRRCCSPLGLKASGGSVGHQQIWARDSMIASLGARLVGDAEIQKTLRANVSLLKGHQAPNGAIPNNVDCETLRPNYRAYADGGLWWIIASNCLSPDPDTVRSILQWYECQDVDQSSLLSMQEASDWEDLFCTRGKGLYLNCLYVLALRSAAKLLDQSDPAEADRHRRRADSVARALNRWFWYSGDGNMLRHISHHFSTESTGAYDSLGRKRWIPEKKYLVAESYYLPYLAIRSAGEWFDSLGNLMAILAGVADATQADTILDFISRHQLNTPPMRSLTPAVRPGDPDWRDYYGSLNTPNHYHNGGIWPFIGGFYVAALVASGRHAAARLALDDLAKLNLRGDFNEWHHGETGAPMGVKYQAWSAGMYLFALECVRHGHVEF
jgi:glycogen debranching enzyme